MFVRQDERQEDSLVVDSAVSGGRLIICFLDDLDAGWRGVRHARAQGVPTSDVGLLVRDRTEVRALHPGVGSRLRFQGVGPLLDLIATAITGGVLPRRTEFLDEESDLTIDDVLRIGIELEAGHIAVFVLSTVHGSSTTMHAPRTRRVLAGLTDLGGKVEMHRLSQRALEMADQRAHPR